MNKIEINNVTKCYGKVPAINDISRSFEHGKIYGLLGGDEGGKSTLINITANRIFAQKGEVTIDGFPQKKI